MGSVTLFGSIFDPFFDCRINILFTVSGQTCAHVAALHGHVEVLRHLVWYGADINAREGCMGYTALHYAVERRDEAIVQFLLQCETLNVEVETYGGRNALEVNRILPPSISQGLRKRGVHSPYSSDDSDDEIDSEDNGDEVSLVCILNTCKTYLIYYLFVCNFQHIYLRFVVN